MKNLAIPVAALTLCLLAPSSSTAGTLVIITRPGGTGWQFQDADKVLINGKNKIRLAASGTAEIGKEAYKQLPAELLGAAPLRIHRAGYLAHRSGTEWVPAVPDGLSLKSAASAAGLWSAARILVQEGKGSKGTEVPAANLFAILPGSEASTAVAGFLTQEANFTGTEERDPAASFDERMSLLVAVAGTATGPASDQIKSILLSVMETALQRSAAPVAKYADIQEGLQFAAVSAKAYPNDPRQKKTREALKKKAWIDQRMAILRAFNAGGLWDAFIDKYGEFEHFDNRLRLVWRARTHGI